MATPDRSASHSASDRSGTATGMVTSSSPTGYSSRPPTVGCRFAPLPPPTDEAIAALAARIARRTTRIVARHDDDAGDDEPPDALALAQADAIQLPLALQHRHAELAP